MACSGHVVGPVGSTRWSFSAFIGIGGRGGAAGFGGGFLLPRGRSSLTGRRRPDGGSLEAPARLHDGVYNYSNKKKTFMTLTGRTRPGPRSDHQLRTSADNSHMNRKISLKHLKDVQVVCSRRSTETGSCYVTVHVLFSTCSQCLICLIK